MEYLLFRVCLFLKRENREAEANLASLVMKTEKRKLFKIH